MGTTARPIGEVYMIFTKGGRQRLLKLMVVQDVSQRELAKAIGWKSHTYLGRFIRGQVPSIDTDAAARIAHHFGVGIDDLFMVKVSSVDSAPVQRRATGRAA